MVYIYLFLILFSISSFLAIKFNRKIEETIFLTIFLIILIEFLSGIFLNLLFGFYVIIGLSIASFLINIYDIFIKKISYKKNIFTIGCFIFVLTYIIVGYTTKCFIPTEWDEFTHWALVVKNMFFLNSFGFEETSTVIAKTYLSGTSLFQYFCVKLNGNFKESFLYFGMNLTLFSMIIPILKNFKSFKEKKMYIIYILLILLPTLLLNDYYYNTLYVDTILGICFGYSIYSYISIKDSNFDKFDIVNITSSLCMLLFIKSIGIVLAFITVLYILIDNALIKNKFNLKCFFKQNKKILLCIIPCLVVKLLWLIKCEISINDVSNSTPVSFLVKSFSGLNEYKLKVIKNFIMAIFNKKISSVFVPITNFTILLFSFVLEYILIKNSFLKKEKSKYKMLSVALNLGFIIYVICLLISYIGMFSQYEGLRLASFERYTSSYLLGTIFILVILNIENLYNSKSIHFDKFIICISIFLFLNINFDNILNNTLFSHNLDRYYYYNNYVPIKNKIKKNVSNNEKIYFIATNTMGMSLWVSRYNLSPIKLNTIPKDDASWSIGLPYSENDMWTVYYTKEGWLELLLKEYDYVYLYSIDKKFVDSFGSLFETKELKNDQLYKVNKDNQTLEFLE